MPLDWTGATCLTTLSCRSSSICPWWTVPGFHQCAAPGTTSFTPQTCGGDLSLSSISQLRLTCAPLTLTSFNRSSRSTHSTCSMSASRWLISPLCSPPPPFSQPTSPVVYTICCWMSHDMSAAMASSSLTYYDRDYSYISDLDCNEYTVCILWRPCWSGWQLHRICRGSMWHSVPVGKLHH